MKCPHPKCGLEIPDAEIARYLASKGGRTSGPCKARDPEKMRAAQKKSVEARLRNKQKTAQKMIMKTFTEIMAMLSEGETITTKRVAELMSITTPAAYKILAEAEVNGLVDKFGYAVKGRLGGSEAPSNSNRRTQSLLWQKR